MNESKLKFLKEEFKNYDQVFENFKLFETCMIDDVMTCKCGKHYWIDCKKFCNCKNDINDTRIH